MKNNNKKIVCYYCDRYESLVGYPQLATQDEIDQLPKEKTDLTNLSVIGDLLVIDTEVIFEYWGEDRNLSESVLNELIKFYYDNIKEFETLTPVEIDDKDMLKDIYMLVIRWIDEYDSDIEEEEKYYYKNDPVEVKKLLTLKSILGRCEDFGSAEEQKNFFENTLFNLSISDDDLNIEWGTIDGEPCLVSTDLYYYDKLGRKLVAY